MAWKSLAPQVLMRSLNTLVALTLVLFMAAPVSAFAADDGDFIRKWSDYEQTQEYKDALGNKENATWNMVADAMDNLFEVAKKAYANGDADLAYDAVNQAYYGYYETTGFERNAMSYIAGSRKTEVENQFSLAKSYAKKGGSVSEFTDAVTVLQAQHGVLDLLFFFICRFLSGFFLFCFTVIIKQAELFTAFVGDIGFRNQMTGAYIQPADQQVRIDDPCIQLHYDVHNFACRVGIAFKIARTVCVYGRYSAVKILSDFPGVWLAGLSHIVNCMFGRFTRCGDGQALSVIIDMQDYLFCHEPLFDKIEDKQLRHFTDDQTGFVIVIRLFQHLSRRKGICSGTIGFDIFHRDRFPAPRMIYQKPPGWDDESFAISPIV